MDFEKRPSGLLTPAASGLLAKGKYFGQIIRDGKVIDEFEDDNVVVNEGLNHVLDVTFHAGSQVSTWYIGIFRGNYTPTALDTAAGIAAAANEITTQYNAGGRPEYAEGAVASQSITNSASRASFVFNATETVVGAFLISSVTKGGTAGVLMSAARFASSKAVTSGDELLLTYQFTASSV